MNWTEGKLARHSRAREGNKLSQLRQKEHFAKARAGQLPSSSKKTPPLFSEFFQAPAAHQASQPASFSLPALLETVTGSSHSKGTARKRRRSSICPKDPEGTSTPATKFSHILPFPGQQHQPYTPVTYEDELKIHEKRRKLLRDHDWAGTSLQKPIPVQSGESLSRRRWSKRSRAANLNQGAALGNRMVHARKSEAPMTSHMDQGVRITIGSQQIRLGNPSSTIQGGTRSSQAPGIITASLRFRGRSPTHRDVSHPGADVELGSRVPDRGDNVSSSMLPPPKRHASVITFGNSSSMHHAEAVRHRHNDLHEPVPIRRLHELDAMLTGQADPTAAESMIAQVGMQTSPFPLDEKEEDEAWRKWVAPTQDTDSSATDLDTARLRVSPGLSAWHHPPDSSRITQEGPSLDVSTETPTDGPASSSYASRRLDDLSSLPDYMGNAAAEIGHLYTTQDFSCSADKDESCGLAGENCLSSPVDSVSQKGPTCRSRSTSSSCLVSSGSSSRAYSPDQDLSGIHDRGLEIALQHLSRRNEGDSNKAIRADAHIDSDGGEGDQTHLPDHEQEQQDDRQSRPVRPTVTPTVAQNEEIDSNELWYKFVFSDNDTDDLHQQVLAQAQQESTHASKLPKQASEERAEADQSQLGYNMSTVATEGLPSIGPSEVGNDLASVPEACASHEAAFGSPDTAPVPSDTSMFQGWEGTGGPLYAAPSTHAEAVSASSSASLVLEDQGTKETEETVSTGSSMAPRSTDAPSTTASITAQQPEPVANNAFPKESFRFVPPKPFVGRFAEPLPARYSNTAVKPVTMNKPPRGRAKNRARDGRLDIRRVPKYEGDPIEDFDDPGVEQRVQPSLFGALDTETE